MKIGQKDGLTVEVSEKANNKSVVAIGPSGLGKSTLMRNCFVNSSSECEKGITFNLNNSMRGNMHPEVQGKYDALVKVIDVATEGIPVDLFTPMTLMSGSIESTDAVVDRVTSMISNACGLAESYSEFLRMALEEMQDGNYYETRGLKMIIDWLTIQDKANMKKMLPKIRPICGKNYFHIGDFLEDEAKIIEFDLSGISDNKVRLQVIEFVLDYIVYKAETGRFKETGLAVYFDEAQQYKEPNKDGGALSKILGMGRKNGVRTYLTMLSWINCSKHMKALVGQCATTCYFKPADDEARKVAEMIDKKRANNIMWKFQELKKGDFIVKGDLVVGGQEVLGYTSARLDLPDIDENSEEYNE